MEELGVPISSLASATRPGPPRARDGQDGAAAVNRDRDVRRCVWIGMGVNAAVMALKLLAGLLAGSRALIADAAHSLTDIATDVALLVGSGYWSRPPDTLHPYGHRRFETLFALAIGGTLGAAGFAIGWRAAVALADATATARAPGGAAFVVALVCLAAKEALFRWTHRWARRTHSLALQANAWHHRSDALSTIPVAIAVGVARLSPRLSFLDSVGALVVSVLLLQAAWRIMRPAFGEITELGAPRTLIGEIERLARRTGGVLDVHAIRTRYAAGRVRVDLHVLVDPATSVREGHRISSHVCDAIHAHVEDVIEVLVHIEPFDPPTSASTVKATDPAGSPGRPSARSSRRPAPALATFS